ncbi:hypothetical protein ACLOJK_019753 [Asimina triloba]
MESRTSHSFRGSKAGHPPQPQREERSPSQWIVARPLPVADGPSPEDRAPSNSPNPSGESPNGPMMKSLQQQMIHAQLDAASIPLADIPSPSVVTVLTLNMALVAHHLQVTSRPHPSSTLRAPDVNNLLALHLQIQSIPDRFQIPEMSIFKPASNPTGNVVSYNIHIDLRTTSEGLKCRAFPATLEEQEKMWFVPFTPGSITSFRQLTDLFKARLNDQRQRPVTAAQIICVD